MLSEILVAYWNRAGEKKKKKVSRLSIASYFLIFFKSLTLRCGRIKREYDLDGIMRWGISNVCIWQNPSMSVKVPLHFNESGNALLYVTTAELGTTYVL